MEQRSITLSALGENALKWVLHKCNIPNYAFSIGEPVEQCVCLEKQNGKYTVFMVERGMRFEESQHESERDAHFKMLYHLAPTLEDYNEMCSMYDHRIVAQKKSNGRYRNYTRGRPLNWGAISKPPFRDTTICVGDTVRVYTKNKINSHDPIQVFQGTVIGRTNNGANQTIKVRHTNCGVSFEKEFVINSPQIDLIETISKGRIDVPRHTKSYRRTGKTARFKKKSSL